MTKLVTLLDELVTIFVISPKSPLFNNYFDFQNLLYNIAVGYK